jgi:hypothetical protein
MVEAYMSKQQSSGSQAPIGTKAAFDTASENGSPIARPVTTTENAASESQPSPPRESGVPDVTDARKEFAYAVHKYVRDNIQLADQKAAFFFTGATALLAFLFKNGTSEYWIKPLMQWNVIDITAFVAMGGLGAGSLLAISVVWPRLPGSRRGFIFWEAVAEYETAREYADDVARLSAATLSQCVSEHCHDLSKVCRAKYKHLRFSIWLCSIGLAASVCIFLFGHAMAVP